MRDVINAGASNSIEATVAAGCDPPRRSGGWVNLAPRQSLLDEAGSQPRSQVAQLRVSSTPGRINDKLARQALEASSRAKATRRRSIEARASRSSPTTAL